MSDNDLSMKVIRKHHPIDISFFVCSLSVMLPKSNTLTHGSRRQAFTSGQLENSVAPSFRRKSPGRARVARLDFRRRISH